MTHVSTKTIGSKAFSGVRFVIRKMNKRRADALEELQAGSREKLKPIYEEFTPIDTERSDAVEAANAVVKPERDRLIAAGATKIEAAVSVPLGKIGFPDDKLKRWVELLGQISKIEENELAPVAARFCLVRIEDLEITYPDAEGNDQTSPATLDLMLANGPDELYREILTAIKRECGLLPDEVDNLNSPSTSAVAVDGKPESAASVETPETITPLAA
jgi:hypothetical protein